MVKWHLIAAVGSRAMAHKPALIALLLAVIGAGLTNVASADAVPPVIIKTLISDEVVDPEGNQTTTLHVEKIATNESAAHNIAQYTLEFSESMETAEVLEAFTRKADGKILEVDRTQIFPQAPPGSPQAPKFTDRKQKVVVFPNVTAGDMVVYTIRRTGKPFFPGQFFSGGFFQRGFAFEDARINITLPKAMAARVEVHGVEHRVTEGGQTTTHSFLYRNPQPPMAEATGLSCGCKSPRSERARQDDFLTIAIA
jgi:Domain of Unknown Function with PDB structure (DUF3857)